MNKIAIGLVVAVAAAGGGYYYASNAAQVAAEEAVHKLEMDIEAAIPQSDLTYGKISADLFAGSAQVADLALRIGDQTIVKAALMDMAGDDATIKLAQLTNLDVSFEKGRDSLKANIGTASLSGVNIAWLQGFINKLKNNPEAALNSIDSLSFDGFSLIQVSANVTNRGKDALALENTNFQLSGVKNGAIQKASLSGTVRHKDGAMARNSFTSSLGEFNISGLRFAPLTKALIRDDERAMMAELRKAFGINNIALKDFAFNAPKDGIDIALASGSVDVNDSIIEQFLLKGMNFTNQDEDMAGKIEEAQFKGLDLSIDYASEEVVLQNASRLFGLTDISLKNASLREEKDEIGIGELSLTDVAFADGLLIKGKTTIKDLRLPLAAIKQMDRSTARKIKKITNSENFVLSLVSAVEMDPQKGTYDFSQEIGVQDFGNIKLAAAFADLNVDLIKQASRVTDIFQAMVIWGQVAETISVSSLDFEYNDQQLADIILAEAPDINQLISMSNMQLDMMLAAYPAEKESLKAAVKGFLENKNQFQLSASGKAPVKLKDMERLFMSGELTNAMTFTFVGN